MTDKFLPPHGLIKDLSERFNCSRHTVRRALREPKAGGKLTEKIRNFYQEKYG